MKYSNPPAAVAVAANHTAVTQAQALGQIEIENLIKLVEPEEDSKSTSISAYFGIHDSLTLKKYKNIQKLVRDDFFDGDELDMIDIEPEVDRAMEAEHDADYLASCPQCISSLRRRGERRGQPHSPAEPTTTSESLIVMTKTHDGGSRDRGTSGFIGAMHRLPEHTTQP